MRFDDELNKTLRQIIYSRPKGYMSPVYSETLLNCINVAIDIIGTCEEQLKDFGYMRLDASNLDKGKTDATD
jgi:hypothetical protein